MHASFAEIQLFAKETITKNETSNTDTSNVTIQSGCARSLVSRQKSRDKKKIISLLPASSINLCLFLFSFINCRLNVL